MQTDNAVILGLFCAIRKIISWFLMRFSAFQGSSMSFRSSVLRRFALAFAAAFIVSACSSGDHAVPLSEVEAIDIPVADVDNQTNQNINNPTLAIPDTFQVRDGDLLTLVWNDEFDGAQLDPEVWFFETGDGSQYGFGSNGVPPGWGNNELQYYLPDNAQLVTRNWLMAFSKSRRVVNWWMTTT